MPHVGDYRAVEVGGADFLAAHRLEKSPAVGGQGKRVPGPGNLEQGPRCARQAGREGLRCSGTRGGGRGFART